jgi:hypothetical protein
MTVVKVPAPLLPASTSVRIALTRLAVVVPSLMVVRTASDSGPGMQSGAEPKYRAPIAPVAKPTVKLETYGFFRKFQMLSAAGFAALI